VWWKKEGFQEIYTVFKESASLGNCQYGGILEILGNFTPHAAKELKAEWCKSVRKQEYSTHISRAIEE